jgi:protein-S-isoprenylcysteine O-methyltransferase Ste14
MSTRLVRRLARWRVPLGFVVAGVVVVLARPTLRSVAAGGVVAVLGEALRVWAAGHLEKSREVTRSGPYRFVRHPLYLGSSLMGLGLVVASRDPVVAVLVIAYLGLTLSAAIRNEEAWLRDRFAGVYDAYAQGAVDRERRFSLDRAMRNREYRALAGLVISLGVLAGKALW